MTRQSSLALARLGLPALPLAFVALPLYMVWPHHVATNFGLSLGLLGGLLFVVRLLDGFELNGRAVSARHDDSFARAQKIGLPRFEPLWLRKLAAGLGQRLGTEPEPVEPLVATNESIDTTGKAW